MGAQHIASRSQCRRRTCGRSIFRLTTQNNGVLFNALRKFLLTVQYFLVHFVSLPITVTLDHSYFNLQLWGKKPSRTLLFEQCLGFTSTPNNLLSKRCTTVYTCSVDGVFLSVLSNIDATLVGHMDPDVFSTQWPRIMNSECVKFVRSLATPQYRWGPE